MAFLVVPSGVDDIVVGRTMHVCSTYEEAEKWAKDYVEARKKRIEDHKIKHHARRVKKETRSFARLKRVMIYEDAGSVPVE